MKNSLKLVVAVLSVLVFTGCEKKEGLQPENVVVFKEGDKVYYFEDFNESNPENIAKVKDMLGVKSVYEYYTGSRYLSGEIGGDLGLESAFLYFFLRDLGKKDRDIQISSYSSNLSPVVIKDYLRLHLNQVIYRLATDNIDSKEYFEYIEVFKVLDYSSYWIDNNITEVFIPIRSSNN